MSIQTNYYLGDGLHLELDFESEHPKAKFNIQCSQHSSLIHRKVLGANDLDHLIDILENYKKVWQVVKSDQPKLNLEGSPDA